MLTKDGGVDDDPYLVASASSDGFIRVWDARMAIKGKPNPLAEANTKSRLTCLAGSSLKCEYSCLFLYTFRPFVCLVNLWPRRLSLLSM